MAAENKPGNELGLSRRPESLRLEQLIQNSETMGRLSAEELDGAFHVGFGVDANFVRGMGVAIVSILENNPEQRFVFHICASSIKESDVPRIHQITHQYHVEIVLYMIDSDAFFELPTFEHLPAATYYRFILAEILSSRIKYLLYMDADIVCLGQISTLRMRDFEQHVICSVAEENLARARKLGLRHQKYFNAGVLYIDLGRWKAGEYSQKALECLAQNREHFSLLDQDALNVVLDGEAVFLDACWNYFYDMGRQTEEVPPDTVFLHYFGAIKPWEVICHHPMQKYYLKYEQLSPWIDEPPTDPFTASKMEQYARLLWQQRKYRDSLRWYMRYIVEKFL